MCVCVYTACIPAPSSSQKDGGKEPRIHRPKDHSDVGQFPNKERSQSGTLQDKNQELRYTVDFSLTIIIIVQKQPVLMYIYTWYMMVQ